MRKLATIFAGAMALAVLAVPSSAFGAFGVNGFDVGFNESDGTPITAAGSHPFEMRTHFNLNTREDPQFPGFGLVPDQDARNLDFSQITGFAGDPFATPQCSTLDFLRAVPAEERGWDCPDDTAVGVVAARVQGVNNNAYAPVFNLVPPPGVAAKLGFVVINTPVTVEVGVVEAPPYRIVAKLTNIPQTLPFTGADFILWGVPGAAAHDALRGRCLALPSTPNVEFRSKGKCPAGGAERPFLTMPRACAGPLFSSYLASSWQASGSLISGDSESAITTDGCPALGFAPGISSQPTGSSAESPTGLDFDVNVDDEELRNPSGRAGSDVKKAVVTLPEGVTINPSQAEGLGVCSEQDLKGETASSEPGEGCPQSSKVGTVEVETPLLEGTVLKGSLFVAKPYENPFDSLIALYMTVKDKRLGIGISLAGKVETDSRTGQLVTTFDELPQLPFSHFHLHFTEGARSPLVTPPACGTYATNARFAPWANPGGSYETSSSFKITSGVNGGPCPSGGLPPFHPELTAGTLSNAAGSYSPFNVRLSRIDSEQEFTNFSIKLPPGITGKLAGIPSCPDQAIAAAKARERTRHGGQEELDSPSCPSASEVGHTLVVAGVGSSLTYVPGKIYLAGPYHGAPLSIVAITAAKAGPFDLGTVVVRYALKIDPETAEVFVDATGSDPIPHIVNGVPVHLRDIRAYVDRPEFVLNPTSCERTSTASTVLGSGFDFASAADDQPVTVTSRFQAADCASLGFKPRLSLRLKGGTKRGKNPALRAVLRPRAGDANSSRVSVQLPHSEFLDQSHIRTVCTRVQFKAGAGNGANCPKGAIYGHARAWTPLLSEPLEGPIFLRSSEHPLPDLVLAVHGLIDFNAVGRIDSVKGGIRNTFDFVPDAPISKVVVNFEGGKKGLLENSTNLCRSKHRAIVKFKGHNGKAFNAKPLLQVKCKKHKKAKKKAKAHKRPAARRALSSLSSW